MGDDMSDDKTELTPERLAEIVDAAQYELAHPHAFHDSEVQSARDTLALHDALVAAREEAARLAGAIREESDLARRLRAERDALTLKLNAGKALADKWEQFCIDRCTQRDRKPLPGHDCGMTRLGAADDLRAVLGGDDQ